MVSPFCFFTLSSVVTLLFLTLRRWDMQCLAGSPVAREWEAGFLPSGSIQCSTVLLLVPHSLSVARFYFSISTPICPLLAFPQLCPPPAWTSLSWVPSPVTSLVSWLPFLPSVTPPPRQQPEIFWKHSCHLVPPPGAPPRLPSMLSVPQLHGALWQRTLPYSEPRTVGDTW